MTKTPAMTHSHTERVREECGTVLCVCVLCLVCEKGSGVGDGMDGWMLMNVLGGVRWYGGELVE